MKTLFQIKETSASSVRHCCRVLSLIVAGLMLSGTVSAKYYTKYNVISDSNNYGDGNYRFSDGVDVAGGECTWTIECRKGNNYFYFSTATDAVNTTAPGLKTSTSSNVESIEDTEYGGIHGALVKTSVACTLNITFKEAGGLVSVSDASGPVPPGPTPGGGIIPITSSTNINGDQLKIYIDGYPNNEYKMSNDYVVTTVSGTEVKELQSKGGEYLYVVLKAASASGTHEFKIQDNTTNTCAKFTITNGSYVSHKSCIEPTDTPIVYWEKYPTIGNNTIDMFGYLAERWCSPVTDAGFYWKETNDITASDIETPAENHKFPAAANPAKNNDSFSKTTPDLSTIITEPTTIYLVNYVTTAGGGTGISDVVALAYSPCFPIPEGGVTLNNSAVSLPEGYKFTFEATARSAGKTPVYKWYLDDALIEGAASNTYEFTMDEADSHTLKVEVTGDCEVSREATANITSCAMPAVTLAAEASTTPWTDVIITATPTAVASAEWSVEPKAELSGTSTSGATFRAGTPGTYTVKYVGASSACDATVNAEAEIEITVNADSEDCVNPNAE